MVSKSICILSCYLSIVLAAENWTPLNQEVCFEAKGKKPGTFKLSQGGFLQGIRLTHKSGGVTCAKDSPPSNFGCDRSGIRGSVGVIVTDANDTPVFPLEHIKNPSWYHFYSNGNTAQSPVISYYNDHSPTYFDAQTDMKVWYGEDLLDKTINDNSGKSCATVEALFVL